MIRKVFLENNYIVGFTNNLDGTNEYDLPKGILTSNRLNCWKLVDGTFVFDTAKEQQQIAQEEIQKEINELKAYLNETDYIWNSIKEGGRTEEYYAEVIERRKQARRRIQELENK